MGLFSKLFGKKPSTDLKTLIKEGAFLVDVRSPDEFSAGSVKGAVNIPVNLVNEQLDKFKNKKHIVVFCRSGARSGQARSILKSNGIEDVTNGRTVGNVSEAVNG